MNKEVAKHREAPAVEVEVSLSVELSECLYDALRKVGRAVFAPLSEEVSRWRAIDSEVKRVYHDLQQVVIVTILVYQAAQVPEDVIIFLLSGRLRLLLPRVQRKSINIRSRRTRLQV